VALPKKWWPLLAATALALPVGASAVTLAETESDKRSQSSAKKQARPSADPVGAEEWMYLQRANPDGSIPDAAVSEAIAQSTSMGRTAMGDPSTDQVWQGLGPSNIGGRSRPDDAGRRLHRHRHRWPVAHCRRW
jgi:hypothetical protein